MQEVAVLPLTGWENFYVIIGSAAAALTGLMFVVITLIASVQVRRSSGAVATFSTPNVVHFCAALFLATTLSAPWQTLWQPGLLLGLCGLWGIAYTIIVIRRSRRQTDYKLVLEDWLGHIIFPLISYTILVVAAILLPGNPGPTLFGIAAVMVLLLFIGIHNAWDTVTYITVEYSQSEHTPQD